MWYRYGQIVVKQILQSFTNWRLHCLINKTGNVRTYNVTLRRVRATVEAVESNKYYIFWVCVCSLSYLACTAHALYCHWWSVRLSNIFPHYLINGTISEKKKKKLLNIKCVFWFSLQILSTTVLIRRWIERDMIINVYWSSCNIPVVVVVIVWRNLLFLDRFSKNTQISNFMKIHSVGAEFFHADEGTDRHDEAISRFSQFCERA